MTDDTKPESIFDIENGGGYEWCALGVYRHPTHPLQYAVFMDTGCSCNYFERPNQEELRAAEPLHRAELRRRVVGFISHYDYFINAGSGIRYLEQLETVLNAEEASWPVT